MKGLVLFLMFTASANAFSFKTTEEGEQIKWQQPIVDYYINIEPDSNLNEDDYIEAVQGSFEEWNSVPDNPLYLNYSGLTRDHGTDYTDKNIIFFNRGEWPENLEPNLMASTFVWNNDEGEILAFDIIINNSFKWGTNGEPYTQDLQNALTHEIGHVLGLGHSEEDTATMFGTSYTGEKSKRTLDEDDIQGISYLYSGLTPGYYQGGSCSILNGTKSYNFAILSLIIIITLTRRKRND